MFDLLAVFISIYIASFLCAMLLQGTFKETIRYSFILYPAMAFIILIWLNYITWYMLNYIVLKMRKTNSLKLAHINFISHNGKSIKNW